MRGAGPVTSTALLAVTLTLAAGCTTPPPDARGNTDEGTSSSPSPSASLFTLSPLPQPDSGPPPGRLVADLRQSSRDAALGRFQVWVANGLDAPVRPSAIWYDDPRLRRPIGAQRLREIPAGSERGYPLAEPSRPRCLADVSGPSAAGAGTAPGRVRVRFAGRTVRVPVEDEADVVARFVARRCLERAVARVADLRFEDTVGVDQPGEGSIGTLVLVATPTGRAGGRLLVETVSGTPLLTPYAAPVWRVGQPVRSDGAVVRLELPVAPARCDGHAFMESGGATAFKVRLRVRQPGSGGRSAGALVVRMSQAGASAAIGFARDSCGLGG